MRGVIPLDERGQVLVNEMMETSVPYVLACGDVRSGSPRQIIAGASDGAMAALAAERLLAAGS